MRSNLRIAFDAQVRETTLEEIRLVCIESGTKIETDFDSVIKNWSRVFVSGRYWFENIKEKQDSAIHWFFFDELIYVMKSFIRQIRNPSYSPSLSQIKVNSSPGLRFSFSTGIISPNLSIQFQDYCGLNSILIKKIDKKQ